MIRRPSFILAILTGLNLLNYMDRTVLAAVLPSVQSKGELNLTDLESGALATAFLVGYFLTSPLFGAIADRAQHLRTKLMTIGVLVWSVATFLSGHAHGFVSMMLARALVGVGEASYASVAPTLIDDMTPHARKGEKLAIFYLAIPVGSAIGYLLGGFLEKHFGWRGAFYAAGGPGAILALSCLLIVDPGVKQRDKPPPLSKMLAPLFREKLYARSVFGYCAQTFALGGFSYWAPKYIHATFSMPLDKANYLFGITLIVAGVIGTGVGGFWADRATRGRDPPGAVRGYLRVCGISGLIAAPFALGCVLSTTPTMFFGLILICESFLFLSASPINAALLQSVPPALRASAMAMSIFAIHLLGDLWSPPLVGVIADHSTIQAGMLLLPFAILLSGIVWIRNGEQTPGGRGLGMPAKGSER